MRTRVSIRTFSVLIAVTLPYAAASDSGHGREGMKGAGEHASHGGHAVGGAEASDLGSS